MQGNHAIMLEIYAQFKFALNFCTINPEVFRNAIILVLSQFCEVHGPTELFCTHCFRKEDIDLSEVETDETPRERCCRSLTTAYRTDYSGKRFISTQTPFPEQIRKVARSHTLKCLSGELIDGDNCLLVAAKDIGCTLYRQFSLYDENARGESRQFAIYLLYLGFSQDRMDRLISSSQFIQSNFNEIISNFNLRSRRRYGMSGNRSAVSPATQTVSSGGSKPLYALEEIVDIRDLWRNLHFSFLSVISKSYFYILTKYPREASSFMPPYGSDTRMMKEYEPSEDMIEEQPMSWIPELDHSDTELELSSVKLSDFANALIGEEMDSPFMYNLLSGRNVILVCRSGRFIKMFMDFCKMLLPPGCVAAKHIAADTIDPDIEEIRKKFNIIVIRNENFTYASGSPFLSIRVSSLETSYEDGEGEVQNLRRYMLNIRGEACESPIITQITKLIRRNVGKGDDKLLAGALKAEISRWVALSALWKTHGGKTKTADDVRKFAMMFRMTTVDLLVLKFLTKAVY